MTSQEYLSSTSGDTESGCFPVNSLPRQNLLKQVQHPVLKSGEDWPQFRDAHPELFDKESPILHRYYLRRMMDSESARVEFVEPDKESFAT